MEQERKIYIVELAELVNRRPATIRQWDRTGILPADCRPERNDRGWRYWTEAQAAKIAKWMDEVDLRPGKGLKHYKPSATQVKAHLDGQRLPRDPESVAARRESKLAAA
jgi:hypothetical protein